MTIFCKFATILQMLPTDRVADPNWFFEEFIVDQNVGHLARRLRFLSLNTLFYEGSNPQEQLRITRKEGRAVLSRNSRLVESGYKTAASNIPILLKAFQNLEDQIRQILDTSHSFLTVSLPKIYKRPSISNSPLQVIFGKCVKDRVPFHAY